MRNGMAMLAVVALALGGSAACATKGFVRTNVGEVNDKVESLTQSLEETQEQTRQNAARIGEVDERAAAANEAAAAAQSAADAVDEKAEALEMASRRLVYEVVLSEDQGNFEFNESVLPEEAKPELDRLAEQLKGEQRPVFIEIEGHTDATGPTAVNERIGLERAEAVKRYLYEQHQIPLHKMSVISYGEEKPVAPNDTRDGRAQNRRVVVKVLA